MDRTKASGSSTTSLREDQFDLWARQVKPSLGNPIQLTRHPGNDINPVTASDGRGRNWLVWQGLREGNSDIYALSIADFGRLPDEIRVTEHPGTDWHPAVAVDSSGGAAIVWDTYRNGDYDIYLRTIGPRGRPGKVEPVSATRYYEANASVVFDSRDRLWVAWEESGPKWGKDYAQESNFAATLLHSDRKIRIRCRSQGTWRRMGQPPGSRFLDLPLNFQEQPRLLVGRNGNLWLIFRQWTSRMYPDEVWNVYAVHFNGERWSRPRELAFSSGRLTQEFPAAAHPDGSVWVLYPTDYRAGGNRRLGQWDLWSSRLTAPPATGEAGDLRPVPPPAPETRYSPTPNKLYETTVGGRTYRLYYGDLHRHTDLVGHGWTDLSISGQYRYALDGAELDFMATTDHNQTYNMVATRGEAGREGGRTGRVWLVANPEGGGHVPVSGPLRVSFRIRAEHGISGGTPEPDLARAAGRADPRRRGHPFGQHSAGPLGKAQGDRRNLHPPLSAGTAGELEMA